MIVDGISVAAREFGLPAGGPFLWRISLPLTSVVLQLCSFCLTRRIGGLILAARLRKCKF
mgnify:CR=1 FL=1